MLVIRFVILSNSSVRAELVDAPETIPIHQSLRHVDRPGTCPALDTSAYGVGVRPFSNSTGQIFS